MEVMVACALFTMMAVGIAGSIISARRITEFCALNNAANSIVWGYIEQLKTSTINLGTPSLSTLPRPADGTHDSQWVTVVTDAAGTQAELKVSDLSTLPADPFSSPLSGSGLRPNTIGPINMTQLSGAHAQNLTLTVWVWADSNYQPVAMSPVTKITVVYTFNFNTGKQLRTIRNSIQFLKSARDSINNLTP